MLPNGWAELVALLDQGPDADPMTRVQRLCTLCVEVAGVAGAAVSVATEDARSTVWATDDVSNVIEDLQDTVGEGPTVDALRTGESVLIADLTASNGRWPAFTPAASELGARALFVIPLQMGAALIGTLTLYRGTTGPLAEGQFKDAWILAEAATVLLMLAPEDAAEPAATWVLGDRSRFRPEVHQAVGSTMVHLAVGPEEAFARLCAHAFATGTPVGVVANDILAGRLRLDSDRHD